MKTRRWTFKLATHIHGQSVHTRNIALYILSLKAVQCVMSLDCLCVHFLKQLLNVAFIGLNESKPCQMYATFHRVFNCTHFVICVFAVSSPQKDALRSNAI